MASTQCFLHHQYALTTPSRSLSQRQIVSTKPNHIVCKAQKQEDDVAAVSVVSRRLALSVLLGAAAVGSKVSPADAAYGEAGIVLQTLFLDEIKINYEFRFFVVREIAWSRNFNRWIKIRRLGF
jgi:hypothetical protein